MFVIEVLVSPHLNRQYELIHITSNVKSNFDEKKVN